MIYPQQQNSQLKKSPFAVRNYTGPYFCNTQLCFARRQQANLLLFANASDGLQFNFTLVLGPCCHVHLSRFSALVLCKNRHQCVCVFWMKEILPNVNYARDRWFFALKLIPISVGIPHPDVKWVYDHFLLLANTLFECRVPEEKRNPIKQYFCHVFPSSLSDLQKKYIQEQHQRWFLFPSITMDIEVPCCRNIMEQRVYYKTKEGRDLEIASQLK